MKQIFAIVVISFLFVSSLAAQEINKRVFDVKSQADILIGLCTRDGLMSCEFASYMLEAYNAYLPQDSITSQLKSIQRDISCVLVMGTWCGDSKEQVPRFFKILDVIDLSFQKFEMFCVDREKNAAGMDIKLKYAIEKVPTFIFYRKGVEIGRIVETPQKSIEKDMLDIISAK